MKTTVDQNMDEHTLPVLEVLATKKNSKQVGSNWLISFKDNNHSEHGEDGIIKKIFEILPPENKWVCEFGAHDPETISNTWRLINQEAWHAVLIEADEFYFQKLKNYYKDNSSVHCLSSKVSYEGNSRLDLLLPNTPAPSNLDFMIIDIDGNDYHVWEAIQNYQAKVVMIEFNAAIPSDISFVQPKNLHINQGSSLKAMVELANRKGYKLIAVTSWNAFFIQEKYFHLFFERADALEDMYVYPAKHPIWMRAFQLYDGSIVIAPWDKMLWHDIDLKTNDYQVLPESYRVFSRELAKQDFILEINGEKSPRQKEDAVYLDKIFQMPENLISRYAQNVFSQYGDDGILQKLIEVVSPGPCYFVDVGAFDGVTFSRSRNLVVNHAWKGLLIENDIAYFEQLKANTLHYPVIKICNSDYSSLEKIFQQNEVPNDLDLLILNIYGNEYYLWESLKTYSPKIVAVQFNPTIPNDVKFIQKNNNAIHHGCSLKALTDLAQYKNYQLVGTTLETAFFVRMEYSYQLFHALGIRNVDLDNMFCPTEMKLFQLYDGTIVLDGLNRLLWQHLRIDEEKLQVVPKALRKFHQFADAAYKKFFYRV